MQLKRIKVINPAEAMVTAQKSALNEAPQPPRVGVHAGQEGAASGCSAAPPSAAALHQTQSVRRSLPSN